LSRGHADTSARCTPFTGVAGTAIARVRFTRERFRPIARSSPSLPGEERVVQDPRWIALSSNAAGFTPKSPQSRQTVSFGFERSIRPSWAGEVVEARRRSGRDSLPTGACSLCPNRDLLPFPARAPSRFRRARARSPRGVTDVACPGSAATNRASLITPRRPPARHTGGSSRRSRGEDLGERDGPLLAGRKRGWSLDRHPGPRPRTRPHPGPGVIRRAVHDGGSG